LLEQIKAFVASQPTEKNLIFLGDFVYHFSYDRGALLALFELFLEFYSQGKNLYILAGNHDRLGSSFVYEEGKQVFDLLQHQQNSGKLHFITKPWLTELEGEKILFLPFCLDLHEEEYSAFPL
jgi:calcineurin-like phosphoesterase